MNNNKINNILDDGKKSWLEVQSVMPESNCDLAIVNAARTSFLGESKGEEEDKKLLFYLYKNKHMSPFEMVEFKFRVRAPAVVWWQWVRHRTWNYNFQSGRYVVFDKDDFYIPKFWRKQSKSNKQGSSLTDVFSLEEENDMQNAFRLHVTYCFNTYDKLIQLGVAKEQARLVLPAWSVYYTAVCKTDLRNLLHFIQLRDHPHAQWEIRQYAKALRDIVKIYCPITAEASEL